MTLAFLGFLLFIGAVALVVTIISNSGPSREQNTAATEVSYSSTGQSAIPLDEKGTWRKLSTAYAGNLGIDQNAKVNYHVASDGKDIVVTAASFSEESSALKGYSGTDGKLKWSIPLPKSVRVPADVADGVAVQATPSERIAVDIATGKELWRKKANGLINPSAPVQGITIDSIFYYTNKTSLAEKLREDPGYRGGFVPGAIIGVDLKTGKEKYRRDIKDDSEGFTTGYRIVRADNTIITLNSEGGMAAFDTSLKPLWRHDSDEFGRDPYMHGMYGFGDFVVFVTNFKSSSPNTLVLDSKTGKKIWAKNTTKNSINQSPVVIGDMMIISDDMAKTIHGINLKNGQEIWSEASSVTNYKGIALTDNTLFEYGHGLIIRNPKTGAIVSENGREFGNTNPVSASGHIVIVAPDGIHGYN